MISRIVDCQVRPEKLNEFRQALHDRFIPRIKTQTGFVDIIESIDPRAAISSATRSGNRTMT